MVIKIQNVNIEIVRSVIVYGNSFMTLNLIWILTKIIAAVTKVCMVLVSVGYLLVIEMKTITLIMDYGMSKVLTTCQVHLTDVTNITIG